MQLGGTTNVIVHIYPYLKIMAVIDIKSAKIAIPVVIEYFHSLFQNVLIGFLYFSAISIVSFSCNTEL